MTVVVHVIGSLDHGGAEKVALDLSRAVPSSQVRQVFYCLSGREGALANEFRESGAEVIAAPAGGTLKRLAALQRIVRTYHADVLVSHVSLASAFVLLFMRRRVQTRIARVHSTGDGRSGARRVLYRGVARLLLPLVATHVLAVSESALAFAVGRWRLLYSRLGVEVRVLVNGVDTARFRISDAFSRHDVRRVVHIGRASPEKNRAILVPIFAELTSLHPGLEMWVVGPGGVADLGRVPEDERFVVVGAVDDAASILQEVDVLILPSIREGLPGVVLEALASGVPVVASNLNTLQELRDLPGITLIDPRAGVAAWAAGILRSFAVTAAERVQISQALEESRFTLERSIDDWLKYWQPAGRS